MFQKETKASRSGRRGFTLIELMVVVAILGILGLIAAQNLFPRIAKARVTTAKTNIETLKAAVEAFRMDNLKPPSNLEELLMPNENNMNEPYLEKEEALTDPWGNPYQYLVQGNSFEIISLGADGMEGGEGENADLSSKGERSSNY